MEYPFLEESDYKKLIVRAGLPVNGDTHACHIIASSNGGPSHIDNYLFMLDGGFNASIKHYYDEFNCFIAGLEKTKQAVRVALMVSQDATLHTWIRKKSNGSPNPLFHDSDLFRKHSKGLYRRGYLRGKAPPGSKGESSPYTEGEIQTIAGRLYKRGEEIWKEGFMKFMKLTNMAWQKHPESNNDLPTPKELVDRYKIFTDLIDVSYNLGKITSFSFKHKGRWLKVPYKEFVKLAENQGVEAPFKGLDTDSGPISYQLEGDLQTPGASGSGSIQPLAFTSSPGRPPSPITIDLGPEEVPLRSEDSAHAGEARLCGRHKRGKNTTLYPTTKEDYDNSPTRCQAMYTSRGDNQGKQCTSKVNNGGQNVFSRAVGTIIRSISFGQEATSVSERSTAVSEHAGEARLCGTHKRGKNTTLYPTTKEDYDSSPDRCQAMNTSRGKNQGKQCTKKVKG